MGNAIAVGYSLRDKFRLLRSIGFVMSKPDVQASDAVRSTADIYHWAAVWLSQDDEVGSPQVVGIRWKTLEEGDGGRCSRFEDLDQTGSKSNSRQQILHNILIGKEHVMHGVFECGVRQGEKTPTEPQGVLVLGTHVEFGVSYVILPGVSC